MWRGQLEGLAGVARVVAPDLPGFGETPPLGDGTGPTTMDQYADELISLAGALGFDRFVLGGLSMGGYVALALARRHPDRLAGLVLFDTRAEPDTDAKRADRQRDADDVLARGLTWHVRDLPKNLLSPQTIERRRDVVALVEQMIARTSRAGFAAAQRGMAVRRDARPDLAAIACPTLVIVGEDDSITPPEVARSLASAIPGAQLEVIQGAGHMAPLEQPDAVNTILKRFLARS